MLQTLVVILSLLGAGLPQELGVEEKGSGIPYSLSSISALVNKVQARVQKVLTGGGQLVGRLADSAREELAEMKTTGVSVAYEGLQSLFSESSHVNCTHFVGRNTLLCPS